jgi:hypothetical protein
MPPVEFEPAISESEQSQTHALDRACNYYSRNFMFRQHLVFLSVVMAHEINHNCLL